MQKLSFGLSFSILFVAATLLFSAKTVRACSCAMNGTVDEVFVGSPNVVVLKVKSVEKTAEPPPRLVNYGGIKQTILTVEKVFKGNLKVGQELIFAQGGGADCVWTFTEESIDQEYLFYLGAGPLDKKDGDNVIAATGQFPKIVAKGIWVASTCSRSGPVKYRASDLKYLENISKVRGKTRLSGTMSRYVSAATADDKPLYETLANYTIKLTGNGKALDLKTDVDGSYEVYDLPPGKYKLTPEKIPGFRFYGSKDGSVELEIKPRSHAERDFDYRIANAIRGKLYDANGKTLKDVCLDLLPANGKKAEYFYEADCTKEDGSFEMDEIPSGTYVIVVNKDGKVTASEPFGTFYCPSAIRREDAVEITIGPGDFRENLIINAPNTAETITVSGAVRFENGRYDSVNAEYVSVEFKLNEDGGKESEESRGTVDKNGNFKIRILKGQKGKLFAELMTYRGEYEKCPKLEALIRKSGDRIVEIRTNEISVAAVDDIANVDLTFPFPLCKKKEIE